MPQLLGFFVAFVIVLKLIRCMQHSFRYLVGQSWQGLSTAVTTHGEGRFLEGRFGYNQPVFREAMRRAGNYGGSAKACSSGGA